jgi:hypothetical protein
MGVKELRLLLVSTATFVLLAIPFTVSVAEYPEVAYFSPNLYAEVSSLPPPFPSLMAEWEFSFQYDDVWDRLADCESGDRDSSGTPIEGSARWWYGDPEREHPSWGLNLFHGGLQFLPQTWSWVAPMVLDDPPEFAWQATQSDQVLVAIRTQELQGWEAWPNCSRKIGLLAE